MKARVFAYFALIAITTSWLNAGVVPGRWEKLEALETGSKIIVFLRPGDRLECTLQENTEEYLVVSTEEERDLKLPKDTIEKITGPRVIEDSTGNGTWIGAGIGFGVGFASMVAWEKSKTASGYSLAEENLGWALLGGTIGALGGALVGRAIDAGTKSYEVLYSAH
jgi:hypothetical protein